MFRNQTNGGESMAEIKDIAVDIQTEVEKLDEGGKQMTLGFIQGLTISKGLTDAAAQSEQSAS